MKISRHGLNYWMDLRVRGKRIRRSLGTSEYYLALDKAREIAEELRRPKPKGTDLAEFIEKYRAWARETKPASFAAENYRLDIIKAWHRNAGLSTLEAITPYHVEQFRAALMTREKGHIDKTIGRTTSNRYLALLRTIFNKAEDWGVFSGVNPVSKVKFYREGNKVRPLTEAEIRKALEIARTISAKKDATPMARALYDICVLILNTGLRRSEALGLRWVDVGDEELRIRGKGGKVRTIPINAETALTLGRQLRLSQFVFDVPNRKSESALRRTTETITRHIGVRFHVHLLRHAFASRLIAAGVDIVTAGSLLGHSAGMTTLLYAHSSPELKKRAVMALENAPPVQHTEEA